MDFNKQSRQKEWVHCNNRGSVMCSQHIGQSMSNPTSPLVSPPMSPLMFEDIKVSLRKLIKSLQKFEKFTTASRHDNIMAKHWWAFGLLSTLGVCSAIRYRHCGKIRCGADCNGVQVTRRLIFPFPLNIIIIPCSPFLSPGGLPRSLMHIGINVVSLF